jgi:hypothetical protein
VPAPAEKPTALQMTDEELQLEKARGRSVGLGAVLAVVLYSGFILTTYITVKAANGGGQARQLAAIHAHKIVYIFSGFFFAVASLMVAGVLLHLLLAARSRSRLVPKLAIYAAVVGPVLVALIYPVYTLAQASAAKKFVEGAVHTDAVAKHLSSSGLVEASTTVFRFALLVMALAWVMAGVYSMRVGLLTRLVAAVAIAIGVANFVAPPLAALLQIFWLGAVAIMFLGESDQTPPAWKLGRPVPWSEVNAAQAAGEDPADFEKSQQ